MKKIFQLILLFFLTFTVSASPRTALVIGNSAYKKIPSLPNPVNDASDISVKLKSLGFEVLHENDLSRKEMRKAISRFGEKLKNKGGVGVFFYAGHGMQVKGKNYLIPIGADINSEFEVPDEGVEADLLLRVIDDAKNALNIIVLDACRNNPFASSFRSGSGGLAQMEGGRGTLIAYSTAPGKVAMDGEGRNSPYTKHLLINMTKTGVPIEKVFKNVRIGVEDDSEGTQTPWETSSLRGDFYFVPEVKSLNVVTQSKTVAIKKRIEVKPVIKKVVIEPKMEILQTLAPIQKLVSHSDVNEYKLTIYTNPSDAKVNIPRLDTPFHNGKKLMPGDYNVEISRDGYMSKKQWINIDQDNVEIQVTLIPN